MGLKEVRPFLSHPVSQLHILLLPRGGGEGKERKGKKRKEKARFPLITTQPAAPSKGRNEKE